MSHPDLEKLAKADSNGDTDKYTVDKWNELRDKYIVILEKNDLETLITYSNKQSSYKSQSRYGILYPFLRLFCFADNFLKSDGTNEASVKFEGKYDLEEVHNKRVKEFKKAKSLDVDQIKELLYYNTFRCYTVGLNLESWVNNNQGVRGFINKDKFDALPIVSKLIEPIEALRLQLFHLSSAVYYHVKKTTGIKIKIPKGYDIFRREFALYTAGTIMKKLEKNCETTNTEKNIIEQINKYITSYSALIDELINIATIALNTANQNISSVDECLKLIGAEGASSEKVGIKIKINEKLTVLNKAWFLPDDALNINNLLKNFSQWRSRAVYNRTNILASIRLSIETHNKIISETGTKKKLNIAKINYYTSIITKTIGTLSDNLSVFVPAAGEILLSPISALTTLGEQIVTGSGELNLKQIEIATSYNEISKDEVKIVDDLWTSVLTDIERFIKEGKEYVAKPQVKPEV